MIPTWPKKKKMSVGFSVLVLFVLHNTTSAGPSMLKKKKKKPSGGSACESGLFGCNNKSHFIKLIDRLVVRYE